MDEKEEWREKRNGWERGTDGNGRRVRAERRGEHAIGNGRSSSIKWTMWASWCLDIHIYVTSAIMFLRRA